MSDYKEYLARRPALRPAEDDAGSSRRRMVFGNPFKSVRSSDPQAPPPVHVDEADDIPDVPPASAPVLPPPTVPVPPAPSLPSQQPLQQPSGMKRPLQKEEEKVEKEEEKNSKGVPPPPPAKRADTRTVEAQPQPQPQTQTVRTQTQTAAARRALWSAVRIPDSATEPLDRQAFCARLQMLGGTLAARRALVTELIAQAHAFNARRQLRLLEDYLQSLAS